MTEETQYFYSLTPERVLDAVELTGVRCTGRCMALNSMENRVYQVEIEVEDDKALESEYERYRVVKFYRPGRWSKEQILAEHLFLHQLAEQDIPAVAPLSLGENETLRLVDETNIYFAVFPRIGGRTLDELQEDQLEQLGRLIARVHLVGATAPGSERIRLDTQTYGEENIEYLLSSPSLPEHFRLSFESVARRIVDAAAPWFSDVAFQRIHGDCHVGNVLWRAGQSFLVDFDDMVRGPCVQDLWLLVPGRDEISLKQRERLIAGYEQLRDFSRETTRLIEPLRGLRMIHFSAWIGKRWEDPAFPRVFPGFGSDEYWNGQVSALNECFEIMCGAYS